MFEGYKTYDPTKVKWLTVYECKKCGYIGIAYYALFPNLPHCNPTPYCIGCTYRTHLVELKKQPSDISEHIDNYNQWAEMRSDLFAPILKNKD